MQTDSWPALEIPHMKCATKHNFRLRVMQYQRTKLPADGSTWERFAWPRDPAQAPEIIFQTLRSHLAWLISR